MASTVALLLLGLFMPSLKSTGAQSQTIGVCYGRIGNNLPSEQEVVQLYAANGITKMRIYDPNQPILQALRGSNIELMIGVPNGDLQSLSDASAANLWVQNNILPFSSEVKFRYIAVGNEVKPSDAEAQYVLPAMLNVYSAIISANLQSEIKVSTAIQTSLVANSYPPSAGTFSEAASSFINPIVQFLKQTGGPVLANVYPYFSYIGDPGNINLDYALFTAPGIVFQEGNLLYKNLFDAMLDALFSALEHAGATELEVVVSETGWPSEGGVAATIDNAGTYYRNVISHVNSGTPKKPGKALETYLFAIFDENQKGPAETEKHFGLFSPNMQPKYKIN